MAEDRYFALIPRTTTHSKEVNSLPVTARWIYVILVAERHGLDAPFPAPYDKLHEITGFSSSTIRRAIIALVDGGFMNYEHGGLEANPNMYDLQDDWLKLGDGRK